MAKTRLTVDDAALQAITRTNPQGRLVQPAEVTAAALWLCGPGSESVNGQAIAIAGGVVCAARLTFARVTVSGHSDVAALAPRLAPARSQGRST